MIPAPRFVVFYNGRTEQPEVQTLKLSDSYEKGPEQPEPELTVTIYNINRGYNKELMDACRTLKEYSMYVEQMRTYAKQMPLAEAVERTVDYCIGHNILVEFLRKNRAEVVAVCLYEFDEKAYLQNEREYWYEEGMEDGIAQGENRVNKLHSILIDLGRLDDLKRATQDKFYQKQLMNELLPEETQSV